MNDSIEVKGRSVEEAIEIALKQLNERRENVIIEVLEQPEDRLFGLLVKPAVVKVTPKARVKEEQAEIEREHKEDEERKSDESQPKFAPGLIRLQDGKVAHTATDEKKPTLIPHQSVTVLINDEEIVAETVIEPGDLIHIQSKIIEKVDDVCFITVDSDKLTATMELTPGYTIESIPEDHPPTDTLEIKIKPVRTHQITMTKEKVLQELTKQNITYGVDEEAIEQALKQFHEQKDTVTAVVARGKPAIEGKDGYVEFIIQYEISEMKPKLLDDGTVDFREIREIPVVQVGELLGRIHEPTEGEEGRTVHNDIISPHQVQEAIVKGRGIIVEGGNIIAIESGTIRVDERRPIYQVDIIQKLVHQGDVDLKSGNLSFIGDIEITGNVEETMTVDTTERVLIMNNVHGATVTAGSEIYVNRNVIRSTLTVGKVETVDIERKEQIGEMLEAFKTLERSVWQLMRAYQQSGQQETDAATIIKVLIEQKYESFLKQVNAFFQLLHSHLEEFHVIDVNELLDLLYRAFTRFESDVLNDEMFFMFIEEKLSTLYQHFEEKSKPSGKLTIGQSQQSELFCNGDIYLKGKGSYNSTFHAEGKFITNGFVRGGKIFARKGIEINEVGSGFGVETLLIVPATEKIRMNRAKEDTVIQIGKRKYRFIKEQSYIEAKLDETGSIVLR